MPRFLVCSHTCGHVERSNSNRLSERGYILWSAGGALTNHRKSTTLHSQCRPPCSSTGGFVEVSDALWAKYANQVYDAYAALNDEGKHTRAWAKQKKVIPRQYLTRSRGGLLDVESEAEYENSPSTPGTSTRRTTSSPPPPSESSSREGSAPSTPSIRPDSPPHPEPIWEDIMEHSKTEEYQRFMRIVHIENMDNQQRSKAMAAQMLTFSFPPSDVDNETFQKYKKAFPQLVFNDPNRLWFEWLTIIENMVRIGPGEVSLVRWADFYEAMLMDERTNETWNTLLEADFIYGGFGFHADFATPRPGDRAIPEYKPIPTEKLEACFANIRYLSDHVPVYPQPDQLLSRGRKTHILRQLGDIAREITKTPFPSYYVLDNPLDPIHVNNERTVIKRGFSECTHHVFLPQHIRNKEGSKGDSREAVLRDFVNKTKKYYDLPGLKARQVTPEWFAVPYIRTVRELGELRAFFFGGNLRYILHTPLALERRSGEPPEMLLSPDIAAGITPLDCLKENPGRYEQKVWGLANSRLPKAIQVRGMEEFTDFVNTTFRALVNKDEENMSDRSGKFSDYRIFCRLDVAVLPLSTGEYSWFVNELECSTNAGLGLKENYIGGEHLSIATDLAMALRSYAAVYGRRAQN